MPYGKKKYDYNTKNYVKDAVTLGAGNVVLGAMGQGAIGSKVTSAALPMMGAAYAINTMNKLTKKVNKK